LRLTGLSILALVLWFVITSITTVDFEFIGFYILFTVIILSAITAFFLLYIIAIIDPKEEDEFAEKFNEVKDFLTLKNLLVAGIVFALGRLYWFISSHINFQTNKHFGYEFLGGKRKGSTHHKKH
jgi:hypothetical protein